MSAEELVAQVQRSKKPITRQQLLELKHLLTGQHMEFTSEVDDLDQRYLQQGYRTGVVVDVHIRPRGSKGVEVCLEVEFDQLPRKYYTGRTRAYVLFRSVALHERRKLPVV